MHPFMPSRALLRLLLLAGIAPALAAPTFAQDSDAGYDSYNYFGIGAGKSRTSLDVNRISTDRLGPGLTVTNVDSNNNDNAYKIFLGHQFNRNFGLELGYFNLGRFNFNASTAPPGSLAGRVQVQGANVDVVGTLPITDNFSALGRIGAQVGRTRTNFEGSGAAAGATGTVGHRELNVKVGVGLQYAIADWLLIRGEAERFRINDAVGNKPTVNLYSVSLVFPFGRSAAPTRRSAEVSPAPMVADAPAPVPMAAPAPVVAMAPAAPPAPATRTVSYAAESMFGFDQATLRPAGMQALDGFAQQLQGTTYSAITVKGYADRLGTTEYNQKLSLQRAEAVKAYLVANGKLDGGRIGTTGLSEANPVTAPGECVGQVETAKLIRCLRPDRRVEIAVTGTR